MERADPHVPQAGEHDSLGTLIDRIFEMTNLLPSLSNSSRRAIICVIVVVLAWKLLIWTLEMVVTAACFFLLLMVVFSFFMPDTSLWLLTDVLPLYVEGVKIWLSQVFLSAGQSLKTPTSRTRTPSELNNSSH